MLENNQNKEDLNLITELALEAGQIAMRWFGKDPEVWMKKGDSPVSEADFAVDKFLQEKLMAARPNYGWLSEETDDNEERLDASRIFVVDPIDGTRGFINGMKQWCVSIAVVDNHHPVVGVLECPVLKETITASKGNGAHLNGKALSAPKLQAGSSVRVVGPGSLQTSAIRISDRKVIKQPFVPSLAYRIAMVAMGETDLVLANAHSKDWDLAAADLIVQEANARLTDWAGKTISYNQKDVRQGALVVSHVSCHNEMLDLARQAMNKQTK